MSLNEVATLANKAREGGAKSVAKEKEGQPNQLFQKLLGGLAEKSGQKKVDKKVQKVVHLVGNLPPLSGKLVELILL